MHRFRRFRRLTPLERVTFIWSLFLVPITGAALRLIGLRRWRSFLSKFAPRVSSSRDDWSESSISAAIALARSTSRMVAAASREGFFHGHCLENSVVLWWLLLRRNSPAELHIGVRKSTAGFEAHAWVELFGIAVNDGEGVRQDYVPFGRDITTLGIEPQ